MKRLIMLSAITVAIIISLSASTLMAQPIDYCEGNFDNDYDVDGTDAFVFKSDFGRSALNNPCPIIECQTAEQLEMRIVQLEALLANVTRVMVQGQDTIRFSGVNVQIVDGSGDTEGTVNGLGNLIVGYNEVRGFDNERTGSHNIIVGKGQNYSSYGGLVAGYWNSISGPFSCVSGGQFNEVSEWAASVSGGYDNKASHQSASVSGGRGNEASGFCVSISGGQFNAASGWAASVSGGQYNSASGDYSFVGGGGGDFADEGNEAFGHTSAILGGSKNITGDASLTDHYVGENSSVCGGYVNTASGEWASVSGGLYNIASGERSSVSGGYFNTASGIYSSVSGGDGNEASGTRSSVNGGRTNTASGLNSSVSGGQNRSASGDFDWRGGTYFSDN